MSKHFFFDSYENLTSTREDDRYFEEICDQLKAEQEKLEKQAEFLETLRNTLQEIYATTSISKKTLNKIIFSISKVTDKLGRIPDEEDIHIIISKYIDID